MPWYLAAAVNFLAFVGFLTLTAQAVRADRDIKRLRAQLQPLRRETLEAEARAEDFRLPGKPVTENTPPQTPPLNAGR
jgi:hypothetical protein